MLVLRPGALGDTLLAIPALRALRRASIAPLTLAAHGATSRFLASIGEVQRGIAFDDASLAWLFSAGEPSADEPIVAWLNADRLPQLRRALVVAPGRPSGEQHCAEYLLGTLVSVGVDPTLDSSPLRVRPLESDEVLVHPGSGSASKNWPPCQFAEVIQLLERGGRRVRLIVGEADAASAAAVETCLSRPVAHLEQPPLETLAARLAGCAAYFGNDSGVSHLAGLCGARTVVLFGPTPPAVWRPLGPDVHVESFEVDPRRVVETLG